MAIVNLKVAQISRWREERLADANMACHTALVKNAVREFLTRPDDEQACTRLRDWMRAFQRHGALTRIVLIDSTLEPCLAMPEGESWGDPLAAQCATAALKNSQVVISDLHLSQVSGRLSMDLFVPLTAPLPQDGHPKYGGVFLMEIDPHEFLFPTIQTWPTPSPTAETLLVRREGDEVVFLNELRHRTNTALRLRLSITNSPNVPAVTAALGAEGVVHGMDYRQQPVLAALRRIPDSPWCVVAKRDEAEVTTPLRKEAWTIGIVVAVLTVAGELGIFLIWRDQAYRCSLRDIQERKRIEVELRQNAERFRSFTDAAFEGICLCANGRILDFNEQFVAMFGYISENAYLYCASEGLVTGARGSVDRAVLGAKLKLRPEQVIILAQSVGYAKP